MQSPEMVIEPAVRKYLDSVSVMNVSTSETYRYRLVPFMNYVSTNHRCTITELISKLQERKLSVYDVLAEYAAYLQRLASKNQGRGQASVKRRVHVVKLLLIFHDIEIDEFKLKTKVKLPKSIRREKAPIDKEEIRRILLACEDPRVKTYVLLLACTGMRAREALGLTFANFDLKSDPARVNVPGEITKTKTDRVAFLTREFVKQFEDYTAWRHRARRICYYVHENGTKKNAETIFKPEYRPSDLVFSVPHRDQKNNADTESLYREMIVRTNEVVDRIGLGELESHSKFRKITRHSFRRFVKSAIADLGYSDFSEWFLGHQGSTYYRKKDAERAALFKKIEPYLTFLDLSSLEARGSDLQSRIDSLERENTELKQSISKQIEEAIMKKSYEYERKINELLVERVNDKIEAMIDKVRSDSRDPPVKSA